MSDSVQNGDRLVSPVSLACALLLHAAVLGLFTLLACSPTKKPPENIEIMDLTVVIDENLDKPPDDLKPDKEPPKPPEPKPPKPPEPKPPKDDPPKIDEPKADAVVKTVDPPPPKPFQKGTRVTRKDDPPKPFQRGARAVGNGPRTEKKLSQAEIERLLRMGARPGTKNQMPTDELSRCFSLIKMRFCEIWDRQKPSWSPNLRTALLEIRFGPGGKVVQTSLSRSSGDAEVDRSIRSAASAMGTVYGLTADFIREHPVVTIDCEVAPE